MKVLLTGATGFIGGHLCRRLVAGGNHVVALVRDPKKAASLPGEVERLEGDLSLFDRPDLALPACDVVMHIAGVVSANAAAEYDAVNFRAVKSLVESVARQSWRPRRLLFASSLASRCADMPRASACAWCCGCGGKCRATG